ncbi:MAG: recombinase zinc beta ribbon domain-containing protein [Candidatus Omnitrophota bacterium]
MTKKQFAYSGLMVCGKCGCAITAEIQKGKYVYYHCTGFKGKCQDRFVREEELTTQFADIVKKLYIDDKTLEFAKQALLQSHKDEFDFHTKRITVLQTQKTKLENRLHQIYVDKIDGKVSEEFFTNASDKWTEEVNELRSAIAKHENADTNYLAQSVYILELCNKAYGLYLRQNTMQNGKLLRHLLSNCTLIDGSLCATYRSPFHLLAKGASCQVWGG